MSKHGIGNKGELRMTTMADLLRSFPEIDDSPTASRLQGALLFNKTRHLPRKPMVYAPGIGIVGQGHKIGYRDDQKCRHDANHYRVTSTTMLFECETFATPEEPLRGRYIDINMGQLHDLIGRIDVKMPIGNGGERIVPRGIGPAILDGEMLAATTRLVKKCLRSEPEAHILGPGIVREILYRALRGTQKRPCSTHWPCTAARFHK